MLTGDLTDRMRLGFEEIWNAKDREAIDEYFHEAFVGHGFGDDAGDLEGYKGWYDLITTAFPDIEFEVGETFAEGDLAAATWRATATHEGPFMGIAPTGNEASVAGITVSRYQDDRVVESWMNFDSMTMLEALGVLPELAPA